MSPRRLLIVLLALVGGVAAPGRAAAQDPDSARATFEREHLCHGAQVLVSTTFAERFRGRCVLQDARLLIVDRHGVEQPILYTAVDSIWVRGPGTRAGTVTGAWIGGSLVGALSGLFFYAICDHGCAPDVVRAAAAGGAVGAFSGGVAGGLIGRQVRVWIRRYPR